MELDTTLLDKTGPITVDDLKAYFRKNDYTTAKSPFNPLSASDAENRIYRIACEKFRQAWCDEQQLFDGKSLFNNLSVESPVRCLEKADEQLVAGKVTQLMFDDKQLDEYFGVFFSVMEEPLISAFNKYANEQNITVDEISDDEAMRIAEEVSRPFLSKMMNLLLQAQSVPEILNLEDMLPAHEDFEKKSAKNYNNIDFERKWNHSRTKSGIPIPLDSAEADIADNSIDDALKEMLMKEAEAEFLATLDETDRKIYMMRSQGKTQSEIADALGYKTHSAVTKRMAYIKSAYMKFINE